MTIHEIFTAAGWIRYDTNHWRVVKEPVTGEVDGLPQLRGVVIATNGLMAMLRLTGAPRPVYRDGDLVHFSQFIEIHLASFKPDDVELYEEEVKPEGKKTKKPKLQIDYGEIV